MRKFLPAVIVVASLVLGATVFRGEVASAAMQALQVFVTNDAANPVPITQQGTASVKAAPADAADWAGLNAVQGVSRSFESGPMLLSFIVAHLGPGITELDFRLGEGAGSVRLVLNGPLGWASGQQHYNLSLAQPVRVDRWVAHCGVTTADQCDVFVSVLGTRAP